MINYQEIVEGLKTEDVIHLMEELGATEWKDSGNAIIFKTICHNEDVDEASHKLYYYKDTHLFYCYTQCAALSIFKLLKQYYETRNIEYDWYNDIYNVILNCSTYEVSRAGHQTNAWRSKRGDYAPQKNRKELPAFEKGVLNCFINFYAPEWLNDGITKESMDKFGIRYSISQNKIIIPHYDIQGRLIGIRGRALNTWEIENLGKYMPVQIEGKWYSHPLSLNLYGLFENKEEIKKRGYVCIFEGEKSVLQMESFTGPHIGVSSCGNKINKYQIDLLMKYCQPREIIICFDSDQNDFDELYKMCKNYKNYANMSFTFDKKGLLGEKESPTDRGEDVFNKLLEGRVRVL